MMKFFFILSSFLGFLSCTTSRNISTANKNLDGDILIQNVNIIDVENDRVLKNHDVVIKGKIISGISAHGKKKLVAASIIDGEGKYLIPGLWDMHVHSVDSSFLRWFVVNGVTGIRI